MRRRVDAILTLHPELAAHFGAALAQIGLFGIMPADFLKIIAVPVVDLAQEAARRTDWLPSGAKGMQAHYRPSGWPTFNSHIQSLVDAPLVTAEIAAGLRTYPDTASMLSLVNLRLVDPSYFDAALPVALAIVLQKRAHS